MEVKKVNRYQFDKISSNMAKEHGTIKSGTEDMYAMMLAAMEGNMLKQYRQNQDMTGRLVVDAIRICLYKTHEKLSGNEYDLSSFTAPETEQLVYALLMGFDPFTNEEVKEVLSASFDLADQEMLRVYYGVPVKCLLRIEKSVELWTKEWGSGGYFKFLEQHMGHLIEHNQEMKYSVLLSGEGNN